MLKNKRCLITGGAGLIGSHIADLLVREGATEVLIFDNFTRGQRDNLNWAGENGKVRIIEGDIREAGLLKKYMAGIDTVFHEAALRITHCAEQPDLAHEVLATGTFNVLQACVEAGVRKVVAASSASIYGLANDFPTREDHHPYNSDTIYGAAKTYLEGLLRSLHEMYGLDYITLRYFNVYGPRMDKTGKYTEVLIRWLERLDSGNPPVIYGDGNQTVDFVYVTDVARANILAAKSDTSNEAFNIASGRETSLNDLVKILMRLTGVETEVIYQPERKVNPVTRRWAATKKAEEMLGFKAEVSLEDGLKNLLDWWSRTGKRRE